MNACMRGRSETVALLLNAGAEVYAVDGQVIY